MARRALACLAAALLSGCGPLDNPLADDAPLGRSEEPIVNGSLDTVHQSAVAYLQGGKCSASIIEVNVATGEGYALTAAHCINGNPGVIRQGNDHNNPVAEYPVVERAQHPEYAESSYYDFAMLRFTGASGATPFTPPMNDGNDNIIGGSQVDLVGYGQTESGGTSLRHHIVKPVVQSGKLRLYFDQASSGICSGDSGGPGYRAVQSVEYVGAVNVAVTDTGCVGPMYYGITLRVSAVESTFIRPFIDNTAYQAQTCGQCTEAHVGDGACTQSLIDCFDDVDCDAYETCLDTCSTQVCVNQCKQMHPSGSQMYQLIIDCVCNTGCPTECTGDPLCEPPPQCFMNWPEAGCETCANQTCCAEQSACSIDSMCVKCFGTDTPPAYCVTYASAVELTECLEQSCADECGVMPMTTGAGGGTTGVGGGMSSSVAAGTGGTTPVEDDFEVVQGGCGCHAVGLPRSREWLIFGLALLGATCRRRRRDVRFL